MSDDNFTDGELEMLLNESGIAELLETVLYEVPPFTDMPATDIENFGKKLHIMITDIIEERMMNNVLKPRSEDGDAPAEESLVKNNHAPKDNFDVFAVAGRWAQKVKPEGKNGV